MTDEETADLLARSREYIEKHGWTKHQVMDVDGHVCSIGALIGGRQENENIQPAMSMLLAALLGRDPHALHAPVLSASITIWNDAPSRTKQEVLDLFAKAEKIARAGYDPDA